MPKFDKPDSPNIIWGVNALEGDLTRPDDSYIQTGWTQVKPPYEYENYSMNKLYQGFAYYNQLGFPEWDSVTEYQAGKSYVQGSNNRVYKCIQTHSNRNPATSGNEAWWELFEGNREASLNDRGTVSLLSILGTGALGISGQVSFFVFEGVDKREMILKWGESTANSGAENVIVTFDSQFPTTCLAATPTKVNNPSNLPEYVQFISYNASNISGVTYTDVSNRLTGQLTFGWLALGY